MHDSFRRRCDIVAVGLEDHLRRSGDNPFDDSVSDQALVLCLEHDRRSLNFVCALDPFAEDLHLVSNRQFLCNT